MPIPTIQGLPVEVTQMILSELRCTEDLYAAICVSRQFNAAFTNRREHMLMKVIELSLHRPILMEVVGMSHAPNYSNLHYVPESYEVLPGPGDQPREPITDERWRFCRRVAQSRLIHRFQAQHFLRLRQAPKNSDVYSIPSVTKKSTAEEVAEFKRTVNCVAEIYGALRTHMVQLYHRSDPSSRGEGIPHSGVWMRALIEGSLTEQRRFLKGYMKRMMAITD